MNGKPKPKTRKKIQKDDSYSSSEKEEDKKKLTVKITPKGAIGIYGLRKFPIVLYREEYEIINENLIQNGRLDKFIKDNESNLSVKKS